MPNRRYNTKQREEMLTFLQSRHGEHVTVHDVCDYFAGEGVNIGMTTVYRHLDKMVDEGVVKKYTLDTSSAACYEYVDTHSECEKNGCTHLKCIKCGKLIHLHCDDLKATEKHILDEHRFLVDMTRTVIYGLCEACQ